MTFTPPTNCPSCDSTLSWVKDQLYCVNKTCPAKQSKQVEHFAKTLKIKGLGPSTINTLGLTTIHSIYDNPLLSISSDKIREKLLEEIEKSTSASLNELLPAFGIPLIGQSATTKLSVVCNSIFDINEETCRQAGLGETTTNNLLNWLAANLDEYLELPFDFLFKKQKATQGVVCITGKLKSYKNKAEAKKALESVGWRVVDSVTKDTTHLINESGENSAKTKKADSLNITIVTNTKDLLQEIN